LGDERLLRRPRQVVKLGVCAENSSSDGAPYESPHRPTHSSSLANGVILDNSFYRLIVQRLLLVTYSGTSSSDGEERVSRMMNASTARMLTRYNSWADRRYMTALRHSRRAEGRKEVRVSLDKSMTPTCTTSTLSTAIWQAHLGRRDHGFTHGSGADNCNERTLAKTKTDRRLVC